MIPVVYVNNYCIDASTAESILKVSTNLDIMFKFLEAHFGIEFQFHNLSFKEL
jgi:hypothetical protein